MSRRSCEAARADHVDLRLRLIKVCRPVGRARVDKAARAKADVAQLAERVLGKDEVTSSILVIGSIRLTLRLAAGEP
jgi:hypothetical protein